MLFPIRILLRCFTLASDDLAVLCFLLQDLQNLTLETPLITKIKKKQELFSDL